MRNNSPFNVIVFATATLLHIILTEARADVWRDPWRGRCTVSRLDVPGRKMEGLGLPYRQKVGNCYAEVGATLYTASLENRKPGWRASPYVAAANATRYNEYRSFDEDSRAPSGRSVLDDGQNLAALWATNAFGACAFHEVEGVLEAAAARLGGDRHSEAQVLYRSAANLLFNRYQELLDRKTTPSNEEVKLWAGHLLGEWQRRKLPLDLLPSRARIESFAIRNIVERKTKKLKNGTGLVSATLMLGCEARSDEGELKLGRSLSVGFYDNAKSGKNRVWDWTAASKDGLTLVADHFLEADSKTLPMGAGLCSYGFDRPSGVKSYDANGDCIKPTGHAVLIKGAARCPEKNGEPPTKNWYLIQNSWGKDWCPSKSQGPDLFCDRRSDGRVTGSIWVSENFMRAHLRGVDVIEGRSRFESPSSILGKKVPIPTSGSGK